MWKRFLHDYFSYTYKERVGILTLIVLIIGCAFIPMVYPYLVHRQQYDDTKFNNEIARLKLAEADSFIPLAARTERKDEDEVNRYAQPGNPRYTAKTTAEVFRFDPNTATAADWKRLGIKQKTVETIQKYISKGGHFYKPDDIAKIWGLRPDDVKRLTPYVVIEHKETVSARSGEDVPGKRHTYAPKVIQPLDVNTADTAALIALPGIGSKLAQRIINFRDKLGGFYNVEQVAEIYGLPDSTFQKIRSYMVTSGTAIKKIDLNNAALDEMKSHPYIRYGIANAIVAYRNQHGSFSSVSDLRKIMSVTEDTYKKVQPYLTVQ